MLNDESSPLWVEKFVEISLAERPISRVSPTIELQLFLVLLALPITADAEDTDSLNQNESMEKMDQFWMKMNYIVSSRDFSYDRLFDFLHLALNLRTVMMPRGNFIATLKKRKSNFVVVLCNCSDSRCLLY